MADTDKSLNNLRYNQVTQGLEGFGGGSPMWTPLTLVADGGINQLTGDVTAGPGVGSQAATVVSTAAVKTLRSDANINLTGNVQLVSGTNVTLSQVGQAITINSTAGGGATVQAYTPTIAGVGTPTNVGFFYKTDGVSVDVWGTFNSGTSTAVPISFSVPVAINAAHLSSSGAVLGQAFPGRMEPDQVIFYDGSTTSAVFVIAPTATTPGSLPTEVNGSDFLASGDYCFVQFSYPIA